MRRTFRSLVVCGIVVAATSLPNFAQLSVPPAQTGTSTQLTGGNGGFDANGNNGGTVTANGTSEDGRCHCPPVSVTVSFNPATGACGFNTNNPNVTPGSISYKTDTTVNTGPPNNANVTTNGGTHDGGAQSGGNGNASGKAQNTTSVKEQLTSAVAGQVQAGNTGATPVGATQTITYTFTMTPENCEKPCKYSVTITVNYNANGDPYGATAQGS